MSTQNNWHSIVEKALEEDIGAGDITTDAILDENKEGRAKIVCKQNGILAGIHVADYTFNTVDANLKIDKNFDNGDDLKSSDIIMQIRGRISSILKAERVALNFLAHLSGIATLTKQFVNQVDNNFTKIIDTRKTTPLLRYLEKEAVVAGGGSNHRMGLYDMVLIKENHIHAAGGIKNAVEKARRYLKEKKIEAEIEVETTNLEEVEIALECNVNRIMLDNMTIDEMKEGVQLIQNKIDVEASGGVKLDTIRTIANTGVNYISVGAITHSAPSFDFSLLLEDL